MGSLKSGTIRVITPQKILQSPARTLPQSKLLNIYHHTIGFTPFQKLNQIKIDFILANV